MADVAGEKHFLFRAPLDEVLPVGQAPVLQVGIDADIVLLVPERIRLALR